MTNKKWIVVFLILILISFLSLLLLGNSQESGKVAVVRSGASIVREINFENVDTPYTFTIGEKNKTYNVVSVSKDGVSVVGASCPDKVCVRHGVLKNSFSPIVCLPNSLTITLEDASSIDALSK